MNSLFGLVGTFDLLTSPNHGPILIEEDPGAEEIPLQGQSRMRSRLVNSAALSAAVAILPAAVSAATTSDNFIVRTAADLVALCSADQADPMMAPALGFCHGFGVGVYQTLQQTQASLGSKLFCVPTPGPTRSQAFASFVAWVKGRPNVASEPPADAILRYLEETYPCGGSR